MYTEVSDAAVSPSIESHGSSSGGCLQGLTNLCRALLGSSGEVGYSGASGGNHVSGASGEMTMLLKTARRSFVISIAFAGLVTAPGTLSAAALPAGIAAATSSFADSVQYAPHRRTGGGPGCGYGGVFPCSASDWGRCDDGYGGTVFPCGSTGRVRRGGF